MMAKASSGKCIWLELAIVNTLLLIVIDDGIAAAAGGRVNVLDTRMRRIVKPLKKPAATLKTIQSEDGDIIDCVDIYKQPAFDHPALKNHIIQMRPSDDTEEMESKASSSEALAQPSRMNGSCPEGTIPILRTRNNVLDVENSPTTNPIADVSGSHRQTNTNTYQYWV
ncbi:hypothetical protein ACLOJK_026042 [Asimina triloba]